ncbi:MAG: DNA polymerase domain-containing protein [Bacteroidota bacterium]
MTVWLLDEQGNMHACFDPFHPVFYLYFTDNAKSERQKTERLLRNLKLPVVTGSERKLELFSGVDVEVMSVTVHDPLAFNACVRSLQKFLPHYVFYNSNIPLAQMYLYDRQVFPLARCKFIVGNPTGDSPQPLLERIILEDSHDSVNYDVPDLRVMVMRNGTERYAAKFTRSLMLELSYEGKTYTIEQDNPADVLQTFNNHLRCCDPHAIITSWGDATLLPTLIGASKRCGIPLFLNRDLSQNYFTTKERQYWTYGQIIHRDAALMLAGRWHMDSENSFIMGESDIEGVIELARLSQLPMQKQSRAAIGTGLASMQMSYAYRNNILIPAEKKEGEDFKTADELLLSDRGGLVFMPDPGYHESVAELDFASMYPSLMEMHNISPETINCSCCHNEVVPELGYSICEKRRGIVPATLKPVLVKRAYYKKRKKEAKTQKEYQKYDRMQNALKWMLVTCFGYLGYKNARFGRIEAHEAVNAFSREALLTAKEVAEGEGYHLIHAIIDCIWLKKERATQEDYLKLCARIKDVVGVDISLEGIYNWILFPSSKTDPGIPTSGKYVGWYDHGEMKVRGIEARRKDTPYYIKRMQKHLLEILADCNNVREVKALTPKLLSEAAFYLDELRSGRVNPKELVLRRRVQKEVDAYASNTVNALVVRELKHFGITVRAGETIEFIIIDQSGKRDAQKAKSMLTYDLADGYDIGKYTELLLKAIETLLSPFGYDLKTLEQYYGIANKKRRVAKPSSRCCLISTMPRFTRLSRYHKRLAE